MCLVGHDERSCAFVKLRGALWPGEQRGIQSGRPESGHLRHRLRRAAVVGQNGPPARRQLRLRGEHEPRVRAHRLQPGLEAFRAGAPRDQGVRLGHGRAGGQTQGPHGRRLHRAVQPAVRVGALGRPRPKRPQLELLQDKTHLLQRSGR